MRYDYTVFPKKVHVLELKELDAHHPTQSPSDPAGDIEEQPLGIPPPDMAAPSPGLSEAQSAKIAVIACGIFSLGLWAGCWIPEEHNYAVCLPAGATTICTCIMAIIVVVKLRNE